MYPLVVGDRFPIDGGSTGDAVEGAAYPVAALAVENEGAFALVEPKLIVGAVPFSAAALGAMELGVAELGTATPVAGAIVEPVLTDAVLASNGALGGADVGDLGGMIAAKDGESDGIMNPLGVADAEEAGVDAAVGANGLLVMERQFPGWLPTMAATRIHSE
jgi:hypothetical protein